MATTRREFPHVNDAIIKAQPRKSSLTGSHDSPRHLTGKSTGKGVGRAFQGPGIQHGTQLIAQAFANHGGK